MDFSKLSVPETQFALYFKNALNIYFLFNETTFKNQQLTRKEEEELLMLGG